MPQLAALLQAASQERADLRLADFGEAEVCWALKTGLAPLLLRAVKSDAQLSRSPFWRQLKGAELAARVLTTDRMEAMVEIIEGCNRKAVNLTLLKGISICEQYYPELHLRPMRDIDFLVEKDALTIVHSVLLRLGYVQRFTKFRKFYQAHQHEMPWFHPQKGIWVEVHRALFRPGGQLGKLSAFSSGNIKAESTPSSFKGTHVTRLSPELQLAYTASHWAQSLNANGGVFGLLDIIYLLKTTRQELQWEKIFGWVSHTVAATHLYAVLSYLSHGRIMDLQTGILGEAFKKQQSFGTLNLKMIHFLITRHVLEGKVPQRRLTIRNLEIVWRTLLLNHNPFYNLILLFRNFLLPYRIREATFR